ncbi:MAG: hypothetical protein J6R59_10515 [Paludibacteraceae bacterium]|nr:hypothetical protein [Paludibacteraceae bacterium]
MKNIKITLTPEDIGKIIINHLLNEGYEATDKNVIFLTGQRLEGFGMAEHYVTYFDGCEILNVKDNKR